MKFKVGDRVTATEKVEALYSGMYHGKTSAYPYQWFEPGMVGTVVSTDSPSVRRNVLQYVVEFEGVPMSEGGSIWANCHNTTWRVRLDPKQIKGLK